MKKLKKFYPIEELIASDKLKPGFYLIETEAIVKIENTVVNKHGKLNNAKQWKFIEDNSDHFLIPSVILKNGKYIDIYNLKKCPLCNNELTFSKKCNKCSFCKVFNKIKKKQ